MLFLYSENFITNELLYRLSYTGTAKNYIRI